MSHADDRQVSGSPRAAAAVLLQLEAAVDTAAIRDPDAWILNGSSTPLSRGECAQRLAAVPKPVQCSAEVRAGRLNIDCTHISPARLRASASMFTRALFGQYAGVAGRPRLLVYGRQSTLVLTPEEAEEMFRDYQLFMVSRSLGEPDDTERAQGVTAVLRAHASRPGPMRLSTDTGG
jgi:hypothetical protein